jgi:type IV pilus assembly protein PilB
VKKIIAKKLGELLIERKAITPENLSQALAVQKEKGGLIGQILVSLGFTTEEKIAEALTIQYGFPYLPLSSYELDGDVIKIIPENVARQYELVAIDKIGNVLTVAMSNPLNVAAVEDIEMMTKHEVQVFVSTSTDVNEAINRAYATKSQV